jgi:Kef-type K+ transport system membrane component KefB
VTGLAVLILIAFVVFLQRSGSIDSSPTLRWALVGVALVIVVLRGLARRTRR